MSTFVGQLNLHPLTVPGDPDEMLESQYGKVTYREWCQREAKRMWRRHRQTKFVEFCGQVCVATEK